MKLNILAICFLISLVALSTTKAQNATFVYLEPGLNVTLNNATLTPSNVTQMDLAWRNMTYLDGRNATSNATLGLSVISTGNFSGNATLLLAAAYTRSANETARHLPVCALSYFVRSPQSCFVVPNKTLDNWDTRHSRNTIATFVYALHEVAPNGTVVQSFLFNALNWTRTGLNATMGNVSALAVAEWTANLTLNASSTGGGENVTTPTSTPTTTPTTTVPTVPIGTTPTTPVATTPGVPISVTPVPSTVPLTTVPSAPPSPPATNGSNTTTTTFGQVYMAFVQSNQLGVLNVFELPMLPKSWQTVVRIANYSFSGVNHSLQLEMMTMTGPEANTTLPGVLFLESISTPRALNLWDEAYTILSNVSWTNQTSWAPGTTLNDTSSSGNVTSPTSPTSPASPASPASPTSPTSPTSPSSPPSPPSGNVSSLADNTTAVNVSMWEELVNASQDALEYNATLPSFLPILYEQIEAQYSNVSLYVANVTFAPATTNVTYTYLTAIGRVLFTSNGTLEEWGAAPNSSSGNSTASFTPSSTATSDAAAPLSPVFPSLFSALCLALPLAILGIAG